jgi:hypothetical protein
MDQLSLSEIHADGSASRQVWESPIDFEAVMQLDEADRHRTLPVNPALDLVADGSLTLSDYEENNILYTEEWFSLFCPDIYESELCVKARIIACSWATRESMGVKNAIRQGALYAKRGYGHDVMQLIEELDNIILPGASLIKKSYLISNLWNSIESDDRWDGRLERWDGRLEFYRRLSVGPVEASWLRTASSYIDGTLLSILAAYNVRPNPTELRVSNIVAAACAVAHDLIGRNRHQKEGELNLFSLSERGRHDLHRADKFVNGARRLCFGPGVRPHVRGVLVRYLTSYCVAPWFVTHYRPDNPVYTDFCHDWQGPDDKGRRRTLDSRPYNADAFRAVRRSRNMNEATAQPSPYELPLRGAPREYIELAESLTER